MIKYFHELSKEEFSEIVKAKEGQDYTWEKCAKDYPQPEWCSYPNAVCAMMGCWSLVDHLVTWRSYCKKCDLYVPKKAKVTK